jgi:hypothetical protein
MALRRRGLIDDELFARLLGSFPTQLEPIRAVVRALGLNLVTTATPPAAPNKRRATPLTGPLLAAADLSRKTAIPATTKALRRLTEVRISPCSSRSLRSSRRSFSL